MNCHPRNLFTSPAGTNDQSLDISPERFTTTMEGFINKLAKMFEGSLQHVWLVVSNKSVVDSPNLFLEDSFFPPAQPPFPDKDTKNKELKLAFPSMAADLQAKSKDKLKIQICDLVDGLTVEGTTDGVHPTPTVHLEMGKKMANFISSNLN